MNRIIIKPIKSYHFPLAFFDFEKTNSTLPSELSFSEAAKVLPVLADTNPFIMLVLWDDISILIWLGVNFLPKSSNGIENLQPPFL